MKRTFNFVIAILVPFLLAQAALADVHVKSRQSMAAQSYENTIYIKGKRQRSETMSGAMVSLTQCDLRRSVQMNPSARTYMVNPFADTTQTVTKTAASAEKAGVVQTGGTVTMTITTKDTGERKQMFGYVARHLIITTETASSPDACSKTNTKMQTDGWYIDAEFALDCDYGFAGQAYNDGRNGGCTDKYVTKAVGTAKRGYPVYEKMTMFDESGKETYSMVNEVIELSRATLDQALFEVPSDYREVKDAAQMYASVVPARGATSNDSENSERSGLAASMRQAPNSGAAGANVGPKKQGTIRVGLAAIRTGAVGDGIAAADLAAAVRSTLAEYLKQPKVEVVLIEARLDSAIATEAREKDCDFVINATVSHKKGGGGFGSFGQVLGSAVARTGFGGYGSTAANVAGAVAAETIVTAASVSSSVKAKDEITLELKVLKADGSQALGQAYKAKAKSGGDDIITQVVAQAAQAISTAIGA